MPETVMRHCYGCGEDFDDTWSGNRGQQSAYWAHFVECTASGCGESYCPSSNVCTYCDGNGYSEDWDDYDSDSSEGGIHSYDYRPRPIWFGGEGKPYYLGFELEISANAYSTAPITAWCANNGHRDMLYCKEDGSVDGFEIVSHPMTPEYFDSIEWSKFFEMLNHHYPLPRGNSDEAVGHGLHVHVSRTAFPRQSTLARWSYLLNKYRDHTQRVARRRNSNWARFTDFPVSLCLPYDNPRQNGRWELDTENPLRCGCCYERTWVEELSNRIRRQFQTRAYPERYQAVNLTNDNTVEVRVFRSTRKPDEFISSLHYVMATVEFVRTMQPWHATRHATQWDTFADFVAGHPIFSREADVLAGVSATKATPRDIRNWAYEAGYDVGRRGRIPSSIVHAFMTAHANSAFITAS